ncbi:MULTISPECIES: LynF/TruF/PatF family peptide O-prenyltransferase [unclassified Microcoleus]|uniref:LynF/TruF/PatF family peptide O-prenyltransferase n=1 Tax=unclassified Microcoleus TaxID=2642155 RepID=UPI002FD05AB1
MITSDNVLIGSQKNLYHINQHKQVFDIDYLYPLDIVEQFVQEQATNWGLECSCKIEKEQLYPIRFNIFSENSIIEQKINSVLNFFQKVGTKANVKLDYQILRKFLGNNFDLSKVTKIVTGVDLRPDFSKSRLKFWLWLDNYPEKLETAISLCGDREDLRMLYINNYWLVGFDFYLNGHTTIELYPIINSEQLKQKEVHQRLAKVLSVPALEILDAFSTILIGFAPSNQDRLLYGYLVNPNEFINSLQNDMANKVHAYYRNQSVLNTMICLSERELVYGKTENLNLYYQMSKSN